MLPPHHTCNFFFFFFGYTISTLVVRLPLTSLHLFVIHTARKVHPLHMPQWCTNGTETAQGLPGHGRERCEGSRRSCTSAPGVSWRNPFQSCAALCLPKHCPLVFLYYLWPCAQGGGREKGGEASTHSAVSTWFLLGSHAALSNLH